MANDTTNRTLPVSEGERLEILAEYATLRTEILKRIGFRHQLNAISLTATGAILGAVVVVGSAYVALILPLLIPFLALAWVQNDFRIGQLAAHIRKHIESRLEGITWETEVQKGRNEPKGHWHWRRTVVAQTGVFIVIQAISIILGSWEDGALSFEPELVGVGLVAAVVVVFIMRGGARRCEKLG